MGNLLVHDVTHARISVNALQTQCGNLDPKVGVCYRLINRAVTTSFTLSFNIIGDVMTSRGIVAPRGRFFCCLS